MIAWHKNAIKNYSLCFALAVGVPSSKNDLTHSACKYLVVFSIFILTDPYMGKYKHFYVKLKLYLLFTTHFTHKVRHFPFSNARGCGYIIINKITDFLAEISKIRRRVEVEG